MTELSNLSLKRPLPRALTQRLGLSLLLALGGAAAAGCATQRASQVEEEPAAADKTPRKKRPRVKRKRPPPAPVIEETPGVIVGQADLQKGGISWYHDSLAGNLTANGERYDPRARTCAHKKHKFGTRLRVTITDTGASATCRVNDRGPFVAGRVLDVSRALAEELGIVDRGVADGTVVRLIEADGDG